MIVLKASCFSTQVKSQTVIYAELCGAGVPYSLNFDSRFNQDSPVGFRIGQEQVKIAGNDMYILFQYN